MDALRNGLIDGFCVGAPWNSIAVASGLGRIAALGCDIAPDCPEKVLTLPAEGADFAPALIRPSTAPACGAPIRRTARRLRRSSPSRPASAPTARSWPARSAAT